MRSSLWAHASRFLMAMVLGWAGCNEDDVATRRPATPSPPTGQLAMSTGRYLGSPLAAAYAGCVVTSTDPEGGPVRVYAYDGLGRLVHEEYGASGNALFTAFGYQGLCETTFVTGFVEDGVEEVLVRRESTCDPQGWPVEVRELNVDGEPLREPQRWNNRYEGRLLARRELTTSVEECAIRREVVAWQDLRPVTRDTIPMQDCVELDTFTTRYGWQGDHLARVQTRNSGGTETTTYELDASGRLVFIRQGDTVLVSHEYEGDSPWPRRISTYRLDHPGEDPDVRDIAVDCR